MMKIKHLFLFHFLFFCTNAMFAQLEIPRDVRSIIEPSPKKGDFLEVLNYYSKKQDTLKFKAACFLLKNLKIHGSEDFYWADSLNTRIAFEELAYENFSHSIKALDSLKVIHGKLHPVPEVRSDFHFLDAKYLIQNIDEAFSTWDKQKYTFETFCEYILPYRVSVEPIHDWRAKYKSRFSKFIAPSDTTPLNKKIKMLTDNMNLWFVCTYGIETRKEPLPRLGALQLLHRKKGGCEDVAALSVFALRSLGIPATIDIVPFWATSTGGHVLNTAFDANQKPVHFDALLLSDSLHEFIREPAKVFRVTYSAQRNTLAQLVEREDIPNFGLLREQNYIDVTHEYWKVRDIKCSLVENIPGSIVYACVINGGKWKPVWWGTSEDSTVVFTNLAQGAVYLPKYYENGKAFPAGYPVASGYNGVSVLRPDSSKHTVTLKELPKYLKYKAGMKYKLCYYDFEWKTIGIQKATEETKELIFPHVPKNALLVLVPEDSNGKERPFTISDSGERLWW